MATVAAFLLDTNIVSKSNFHVQCDGVVIGDCFPRYSENAAPVDPPIGGHQKMIDPRPHETSEGTFPGVVFCIRVARAPGIAQGAEPVFQNGAK